LATAAIPAENKIESITRRLFSCKSRCCSPSGVLIRPSWPDFGSQPSSLTRAGAVKRFSWRTQSARCEGRSRIPTLVNKLEAQSPVRRCKTFNTPGELLHDLLCVKSNPKPWGRKCWDRGAAGQGPGQATARPTPGPKQARVSPGPGPSVARPWQP
jgi:hypothetical protein